MKPDFLRPFFTFYGGKWNLSSTYPSPRYGTIIEPFAGSAGYSLFHYQRNVILVERDPDIASVWDYLISSSREDILSLPSLSAGEEVESLDVCHGARCLIGFWCGRGRATPGKRISGWGKNEKYSKYYWGPEAKNRIASQVDFIKHWEIIQCSYEDLPLSSFEGTWFIDPPYKSKGNSYVHGSSSIDYRHLSEWCKELLGQVIVCEGEGSGDWLPFKTLGNVYANNGRIREEKVWIK